jgi:putative cardiolipin synthase
MRALRFLTTLLLFPCLATAQVDTAPDWLHEHCPGCIDSLDSTTGVHILELGEESLIARAWLADNAERTIDVQYFIWSTDNIGILAAEALLSAAERGVRVRVLVDDLLIDAQDRTLLLLAGHPNVHIRVYNPNLTVGVSFWQRVRNATTGFRDVNLRMHDKTAIVDGVAGITGGRNMADEYFDFDHHYNFRDRDVLLLGPAVSAMTENFEEFWNSKYAVAVEDILADEMREISEDDVRRRTAHLHAYAEDPVNFEPQVREAIRSAPKYFPVLLENMTWTDVEFISDSPGKNPGQAGLAGGGESTQKLIDAVRSAQSSIRIQSPYLIMPEGGIELFAELVKRGVRIRISTNSLASTDNIQAFSGYYRQRDDLLEAGVELYEFKPHGAIKQELIRRYPRIAENDPIFALHAKSMVIDDRVVFIGTFNLDPRSANLNTEVGMLAENNKLARQVTEAIERDIRPENSWRTTEDFNPDDEVSFGKRMKMWFNRLLPLEPVL